MRPRTVSTGLGGALRGLLALGLAGVCAAAGCGLSTEGLPSPTPLVERTPCDDSTQCLDSNPCTADSCGADGFCASVPFGGGDPPQIEGDCKHVACNGTTEVPSPDPEDEDDGNPCTEDSCEGMTAVHTPIQRGAACTVGPLSGECDGNGSCAVACETDAECNDANDCTDDACDVSTKTCTSSPLSGLLRGATNVAKDCKIWACVAGKEEEVADTTDLPDDGEECTVDECLGTRKVHTPLPEGTPCAAGECSAAGQCKGCVSDSFCGAETECLDPVCVAEVCSPGPKPAGTPVSDASPADCVEIVCDGAGNQTVAFDDTEIPDDGLECTTQACVGGAPVTSFLMNGTPCNLGADVCLSGACVDCIQTADCAANQVCVATQCCNTCASLGKTCGSWPDGCGNTLSCNNGALDPGESDVDCGNISGCKCAVGKACGGVNAACANNTCRDGYCCNTQCTNTCRSCSSAFTGAPNGTCADVIEGLQDPNTCTGSNACNGSSGSGSCVAKKKNGESCSGNSDCASNVCTDSTCCNTPCSGTCKSCLATETGLPVDVCGNVLIDSDPQGDCSNNDCCDGAGSCYDGPVNCN